VSSQPSETLVVLFDGVCGLCNRAVSFILKRDRDARFRFASLQGVAATQFGKRHGFDVSDLDTMYLIVDFGGPNEHVLARSAAVFAVLARLGIGWRLLSYLRWLPRPLTDAAYRMVATSRYRIFGKYESCPVPPPEWRSRFLDLA